MTQGDRSTAGKGSLDPSARGGGRQALRTALIWHDEVMEDLVLDKPRPITLGSHTIRKFSWRHAASLLVGGALAVRLTGYLVPLPLVVLVIAYAGIAAWAILVAWGRPTGHPTFVLPDVGLPAQFAIVRPGNRGYLLTLGEHMRGTISVGGQEQDVAQLVRDSGGFTATSIGGRDWGVVELDASGSYKLFFQFVQVDDPPQFFTKPVLIAGAAGYLISSVTLTLLWHWKGVELLEAVFRGAGIATVTLLGSAIGWSMIRQDGESQASLAFSVVLHAALLFMTYQLYDGDDPFVWPGPRSLTGSYLVTRLEKEEPPEPKPTPTVGKVQQEAAAADTKDPPKKTATKGEEGRAGGKGETERARDPNATDAPPVPPKVQFFEDKNKKVLDNIIDRNLATSLSKFNGMKGDKLTRGSLGFGTGVGTGVGPGEGTGTRTGNKGKGPGGGGGVEGDFVTGPGKIDTGGERPGGGGCKGSGCGTGPKAVQVAMAEPSGDFGGLTAEEIDRVVKQSRGLFKACYQKELNHTPGIGGKLVIHFKIGGDGAVQAGNTSTSGASTLRNDAVETCVKRNVNNLKFPAKGGVANVNYPFVFTQGG